MNERSCRERLDKDKQSAGNGPIIYLEGKTDPPIFFALLGLLQPIDHTHQGVKVIGLRDGRSGSSAVSNLVRVAQAFGYRDVYGVIDGDGDPLSLLSVSFDSPDVGPLFRWKAFCIENLLVKTGVPLVWNIDIHWDDEIQRIAPYAAIKRLVRTINQTLNQLGLANLLTPPLTEPYRSAEEFQSILEAECEHLRSYDVIKRFAEELKLIRTTATNNMDEAHALVDGKWLVEKVAPLLTKRSPDECLTDWIRHAVRVGGLPEVRDWWGRITGSPA